MILVAQELQYCLPWNFLFKSDELLRSLIKLSFGVTDHLVPTRGAAT